MVKSKERIFFAYQIRISTSYNCACKSYLTHPYPSLGKIKIESFQVFDIHWLYRMSRYTMVKVYVTECNDATERHGIVITIWLMSAIEVTPLSKLHFQK